MELPDREREEVAEILREWNLPESAVNEAVEAMSKDSDKWVDFMMKYELGLEKPEPKRALTSSATIGGSYIVGGLIPLFPYMLIQNANSALLLSVIMTLIALFIFGFVKGRFTGANPFKSAFQTTLVGGIAAGIAFLIARLIS